MSRRPGTTYLPAASTDNAVPLVRLPGACCAGGMTSFLYAQGIRSFDYPRFAEPLPDRIRQRAAAAGCLVAKSTGLDHRAAPWPAFECH